MRDPSGRLLQLLSLLQSPREWTGIELAEKLQVTPRTIRRDIERLRELGYPVQATQGNIGGYRLSAGNAMPPLLLDDEEAVAIAVGLRSATTSAVAGIEDAAVRALTKLEQVLPSRLRHRVAGLSHTAVLPAEVHTPETDPDTLVALATASAACERVRFTYTKPGAEQDKRFAEPYRLVAAGPRWYLIAFDLDRGDWRTFRLDRVSAVHRTGVRVPARELPDGLDAATWLTRSLRRSGTMQARVLLHTPLDRARELLGSRPGLLEAVDADSCLLTTYPAAQTYTAATLVTLPLPYTLLEPDELAPLLRDIAERAIAATGPDPRLSE
ncbi:helix-turn-helix transcriptional regulator [Nocardia brasiliensis]|uniref:helix-turn-helix transcriptional regulator n=1 Tax=Nocardia brasiliensis TaxID=37326 RepID=UPI0036726265